MQIVRLANETDFEGWRTAARSLFMHNIAPEVVEWQVSDKTPSLFDTTEYVPTQKLSPQLSVSRDFFALCKTAILYRDPARFGLLYNLLWRMRKEPDLLQISFDSEVIKVRSMAQAVRRDLHKMKAFVRFREIVSEDEGQSNFVAWFEPSHHIVEASAPFFTGRFTNMHWSILTPEICMHWDGQTVSYSPGASKKDAPAEDDGEDLWRSYYRSIFNPARLKVSAMQSQMPKKYWRNLPEAELIADLVANADKRKDVMITAEPTEPQRKIVKYVANKNSTVLPLDSGGVTDALRELNERMLAATEFPLAVHATHAVLGTGMAPATIMLVGEQPGEQEDLSGQPFIGPAGKLLDRALLEAGIQRSEIYITNALKHYKFKIQANRRMHLVPGVGDIMTYLPWLLAEIAIVKPQVIVALGTVAARAIMGKTLSLENNRGKLFTLNEGRQFMLTYHPSFILHSVDKTTRQLRYERLIVDLKSATTA